jgi:N-acetylmuramoyl-L-alanine amidase
VVPGAPSPSSLAGGAINARTVSLSWATSVGAVGYNVYRNGALIGSVDGDLLAAITGAGARASFTDVWAAPGQTYAYEIAAALPTPARALPVSPESTPARVSVRTPPIVVALDPGHGGNDPGAIGGY